MARRRKVKEAVPETTLEKEPIPAPAPPPPPPPQRVPQRVVTVLSKDERCLGKCKAVAELKRRWTEKVAEIEADTKEAESRKAAYEAARFGLGQEEVDWARSKGWAGAI